ncbi:MAG TPA: hypothetical protein PLC12_02665, partial [Candidatus Methanofastidiosa archaeon]|nr:hypothetical protein [Candidatus Methanofastidiosa archaeon]
MDFYPSLLERLTIRLAGKGWHLPAYWSLTLGTFPLATYLYNKESAGARHHLKNIVVVLLLASGVFFAYVFRLYILYIILVAAGRILGTLHHLIASYGLGERPRLGLLSVMPFFYYSIQSIFIRLYGKFFKIPFIFATCGMGPLVLWSWEKGKRMKALSWALSILGIVLLVYIGYALALLFMALGMLFFLAVYIVKAIGGEQEIVHDFPKQEGRWEWAGVAFLAFITISFAANLNKFSPNVIDLWYHLAIARKILELGTIPLWDFWEFAPAGRPHLYPPLSHLLIALFSGSPDNVIQGG